MYLDDDDMFYNKYSIENIVKNTKDIDTLYFLKYKKGENTYPEPFALEHSLNNEPPALGVGFCSSSIAFHSKYLEHTAWDEWSGSDWKTIQSLWYNIPNKSIIDEPIAILTEIPGLGE